MQASGRPPTESAPRTASSWPVGPSVCCGSSDGARRTGACPPACSPTSGRRARRWIRARRRRGARWLRIPSRPSSLWTGNRAGWVAEGRASWFSEKMLLFALSHCLVLTAEIYAFLSESEDDGASSQFELRIYPKPRSAHRFYRLFYFSFLKEISFLIPLFLFCGFREYFGDEKEQAGNVRVGFV